MKIELINKEEFNIIKNIQEKNTGLTFQNVGYQYINKDKLSTEDKNAFDIVSNILKNHIFGFSEFNNFKLTKDNKIQLRFQYNYNYDNNDIPFIGVGYILLDELLYGFKEVFKN